MRGRILLVTALMVTLAAIASAGPQARVYGTVVDSAGKPIPDAVVKITGEEGLEYSKTIDVDDKGRWSALLLDATQKYRFRVEAAGYVPWEEQFKVGIGTMDNEFTFTLPTVEEQAAKQNQEIKEQPGFKEYGEGVELLKAGDTAGARAKFEAAVAAKPDLTEGWIQLTELHYKAGEYDAALTTAKKCLALDDEAPQCLAAAANSALELGLTAEHDQYMARYQELNPDDPATLFNQAVVFINNMDDESARPLLEKCLAADPDFARCLYEYGLILLRAGDMAGAKQQFEHYLEVAPDGADAATVRETLKYL